MGQKKSIYGEKIDGCLSKSVVPPTVDPYLPNVAIFPRGAKSARLGFKSYSNLFLPLGGCAVYDPGMMMNSP